MSLNDVGQLQKHFLPPNAKSKLTPPAVYIMNYPIATKTIRPAMMQFLAT